MEDVLKNIDEYLKARRNIDEYLKARQEEPLPTIPYDLFRTLAKWVLADIEKKLDESADLPAETWERYQQITKEIRDVMEEGGMAALLPHIETSEYHQVYQQWAEVRDKANELDYDIGEVLRKLEEAETGEQ